MQTSQGGAYARINSSYTSLLPAEKRIADVILSSGEQMGNISIGELAERSNASKATVTRFCKRLGYDGFRDFRVSAIIDTHRGMPQHHAAPPVGAGDLEQAVASICESNARACQDTKLLLSVPALERAAEAIVSKRRVILLGEGAVAAVTSDFSQKLLRVGIVAANASDRRIQGMQISLTGPDDAVVAFDLSGHTQATVKLVKEAADNGAQTITICNTIGSPLAKAGQISLYGPGRTGSDISGTLAPRIALMCIVDCLFYAVTAKLGESCEESLQKTNRVILGEWG